MVSEGPISNCICGFQPIFRKFGGKFFAFYQISNAFLNNSRLLPEPAPVWGMAWVWGILLGTFVRSEVKAVGLGYNDLQNPN